MTLLEKPEYNLKLYNVVLEEYRKRNVYDQIRFNKQERDVLLVLLQRAKPKLERKWVRKLVTMDLKKITRKAWSQVEGIELRK